MSYKQILDLAGTKQGHLTILECVGRKNHKSLWKCACDCGNVVEKTSHQLRHSKNKIMKFCGPKCELIAMDRATLIKTHGLSGNNTYGVWKDMKQRCFNPNNRAYKHYGGRGISVCDRWANSFAAFYEDFGSKFIAGTQIDRINNNGNYEPGNCRWATPRENLLNRKR